MSTETADTTVDARGSTCPGPLMDLIAEIRQVEAGTVVALLSDNEKTTDEVTGWAAETGNEVTSVVDEGEYDRIEVQKG
jgi:TusA-related sulfurtransferase